MTCYVFLPAQSAVRDFAIEILIVFESRPLAVAVVVATSSTEFEFVKQPLPGKGVLGEPYNSCQARIFLPSSIRPYFLWAVQIFFGLI